MMKKVMLCLSLSLSMPLLSLADEALPREVQRYVDKREGCDHMRGEIPDPNEKRRMRDVSREIQKLCRGTDRELARLKKKYATNPSVIRRLGEFESTIEEVAPSASRG
jgi:hypothetical protein